MGFREKERKLAHVPNNYYLMHFPFEREITGSKTKCFSKVDMSVKSNRKSFNFHMLEQDSNLPTNSIKYTTIAIYYCANCFYLVSNAVGFGVKSASRHTT